MKESESLSLITSYLARDPSLPVLPWKGTPYVWGGVGRSVTCSHLPSGVKGATWTVTLEGPIVQQRTMYISHPERISSSYQRKWVALPSREPLWTDSSHFNSVTFTPLESIRPTHRLQNLWSVLSESNSLVASPRLLSLLLVLWDSVPVSHLPTHSALTPSLTRSHSSWVKPVLYITILASLYWVFASAKCSLVHRWSVQAKFVRWMSKFRFLNFPSSYICHFIFPHYFLDAYTRGLQSINCHFLVRVRLETALGTLLSLISRVPLWGEQSVYSPPWEATHPVCHPLRHLPVVRTHAAPLA